MGVYLIFTFVLQNVLPDIVNEASVRTQYGRQLQFSSKNRFRNIVPSE